MDTEEQYEDSNLVRDLRKQLKDAQAANKAFAEELGTLKTQHRERSLADVLKAKGVNPKVAKFVPDDVEGEEAVSKWLEEYGDVFGAQPAPTPDAPPVSEEVAHEWQRANALSERGVSPDKVADLEQRIANAGSLEEINAALGEYQKFQL